MIIEENIRRIAGVESEIPVITLNDVKTLMAALSNVNGNKSIDKWKKALKAVSHGGTIEVR